MNNSVSAGCCAVCGLRVIYRLTPMRYIVCLANNTIYRALRGTIYSALRNVKTNTRPRNRSGVCFNLSVPNPIERRQLRLAFVFFGFGAVETVARIFLDAINHRHVRPPGRVWRSSPGVAAVLKENTRSVKTSDLGENNSKFPSTYIDNFFSERLHSLGKFLLFF